MQQAKQRTTKVLPFTTPQGDVPGHELVATQYPWMQSPVKSVVFETFDKEAQMPVEHVVHWTRFTQYTKRLWPKGGSITAVILDNDQRIHCYGSRSVHHYDDKAYHAAPIVCRDTFSVGTDGYTLLEVKGVREWAYSKRDAEATAKYLPCPWARDNAESAARWATAAL